MNAHHIKKKAWFPHLGYQVGNGVTLCKHCHDIVTDREEQFERLFNVVVQKEIVGPKRILKLINKFEEIDKRWIPLVMRKLRILEEKRK